MTSVNTLTMLFCTICLTTPVGCAHARGAGEDVEDGVITTEVNTAIFNEPGLRV